MSDRSIAMNRFGLGARSDDGAIGDPRRWLLDQFAAYEVRPSELSSAPNGATAGQMLAEYQEELRARTAATRAAKGAGMPEPVGRPESLMDSRRDVRALYTESVAARLEAAVASSTPFVERLVHFWANHFAVSSEKLVVGGLAGPFEFDAIRPHVLGRFADMLHAAERHPAMLVYLDQAASIGPESPAGKAAAVRGKRALGLNENLAREILELHTLGVRTGYDQRDVTEFARAMTGWTTAGITRRVRRVDAPPGSFVFDPRRHEPGARTVLGERYDQPGERQAAAVLDRLATHPATARHVATKLVRHFVADDPPAAAVARVESAFLRSGGDLPATYRALVEAPEAWRAGAAKFKSPWEWTVSAMRAIGSEQAMPRQATGLLTQLGQPVWRPGQPSGYDDTAAAWAGPDALMRRVEAAERLAGRTPTFDARARAAALFPDAVSPATAQALSRADSPGQATALLLVAPESLRR